MIRVFLIIISSITLILLFVALILVFGGGINSTKTFQDLKSEEMEEYEKYIKERKKHK